MELRQKAGEDTVKSFILRTITQEEQRGKKLRGEVLVAADKAAVRRRVVRACGLKITP